MPKGSADKVFEQIITNRGVLAKTLHMAIIEINWVRLIEALSKDCSDLSMIGSSYFLI